MEKSYWKKWIKTAGLFLVIAVVLELTVFNFRHYESMRYIHPENVTTVYNGLTDNGDGTYTTAYGEESSIEMSFPFSDVRNVKIDIEKLPLEPGANQVDLRVFASDEGNTFYYGMPQSALYDHAEGKEIEEITTRTILHNVEDSQYIRLHLAGKAKQVKVVLDVGEGQVLRIHEVTLNARVPLQISVLRMGGVFLLFCLCYIFRPKSEFYQFIYNPRCRIQRILIVGFAAVQILVLLFIIYKVDYSLNPDDSCYPVLARVLAKGQLYLDEEPTPELLAMENPYDTNLRSELGVGFKWDYAYYQGKYYVYFGLMPALIFYLPYYLATGQDMPMHLDFYIMIIGFVIGVMLLLHQLVKKYFKKTPFSFYLLLSMAVIWGSGGLYALSHPDRYSVPKFFSIVMTILGLYFWFSSIDEEKEDKVSIWRMVAGSFCMASVAGGRTQMVLGSFLAIPIFWKLFVKFSRKETFSKKNIARFTAFLAPYIVIAAVLMLYNYQRFGSPFDFGANYNLTTNDMTKRGFNIERCGLAVFTFLFQLPAVISQFPYITEVNMITNYMGRTVSQAMMGGLLVCNPVLLTSLCSGKLKGILKEKRLYGLTVMSVIFGFIIVIVDAQMAGILAGYIGDFAIFFFLPAVIFILALLEKTQQSAYKSNWYQGIVLLCAIGILYNVLFVFAGTNINEGTLLFHQVRYALEFWL